MGNVSNGKHNNSDAQKEKFFDYDLQAEWLQISGDLIQMIDIFALFLLLHHVKLKPDLFQQKAFFFLMWQGEESVTVQQIEIQFARNLVKGERGHVAIDVPSLLEDEKGFVQLYSRHALWVNLPAFYVAAGVELAFVAAIEFSHCKNVDAAQYDVGFSGGISLDDTFQLHERSDFFQVTGVIQKDAEADVRVFQVGK